MSKSKRVGTFISDNHPSFTTLWSGGLRNAFLR
jgi:hypothetical protein